jgi:hypothetical protein
MPPNFCPRCKQPLGPPGKGDTTTLRCPACSAAIAPEDAALIDVPPSATAEGRGDEPKRRPVEPWVLVIQPLGRSWRTVYFGLGLIKWGTVAALAALAFNVVVALAAANQALATANHRPAAVRASLPTDDKVGPLAIIIPSALSVVFTLLGRLCCCSVPAGSGARLSAVAAFCGTLLAQLLAAFIVLNTMLLALQAASPLWLLPAVFAAGVTALVAEVLFLVFLYQVGRFLQEPAVGRRVLRLVIGTAMVVVGAAFAVFLLMLSAATLQTAPASAGPFSPGQPPGAQAVAGRVFLAWLAVVFGVALVLAQYLDLINVTRHALARRFARDAAARSTGG